MAGEDGDPDVQGQLDSLLGNLYDFGGDFEDTKGTITENEQPEGSSPEIETEKEPNVREHHLPNVEFPAFKRGKKNPSFFFNAIKDELRNQPKGPDAPSNSVSNAQVEVVTFVSRKDKNKAKSNGTQEQFSKIDTDSKEEEEAQHLDIFDFEKARLEVHKFGITGYKKEKQRKFEQERAIMLGAKPPKREYVNYKVFQEKKKEQEQVKKDNSLTESISEPVKKKQKPGQKVRRPRKPKGSSGFVPDGQVGRFRDGALILSTKDIHKIKQSKPSK